MRSILQNKDGCCYLCMMLNNDYGPKVVEEHHIVFGTSGRRLSEKYGLKCYLCSDHHRNGKDSAHKNHDIAVRLQDIAQRKFEKHFPNEDWMSIFKRNYKIEHSVEEFKEAVKSNEWGFIPLED